MPLPITSITAIVLAAHYLHLTFHVIRLRRRDNVALGDGGSPDLLRAMRGQGNASEQIPLALILMLLCEVQSAPAGLLAVIALPLIAGRWMHGLYFSQPDRHMRLRIGGMFLTLMAQFLLILTLVGILIL